MIKTKVFKQGSGTFSDFIHIWIEDGATYKTILSPEEFKEFKKQINELDIC